MGKFIPNLPWKGYTIINNLENDKNLLKVVKIKKAKLDLTVCDEAITGFPPLFNTKNPIGLVWAILILWLGTVYTHSGALRSLALKLGLKYRHGNKSQE